MNEKNVLVRHAEWIRRAENIGSYGDEQGWCIADLAAEVRALREQVTELEPDATLGRMVREMPQNAKLGYEGQQWGEWYAVWPGDNLKYTRQYGPTPESALEAARKEKT